MKKIPAKLFLLSIIFFALLQTRQYVFAETSGSSPNSGVNSRIKTMYDDITTKTFGSTASGSWGDWGLMWNRLYSAGIWYPTATAGVADVTLGQTFYSSTADRTAKTGTYNPFTTIYQPQSLVEWDDYKGTSGPGDSVWTLTAGAATTGVYKDTRTNLYWSASQGTMSNIFPNTTHTTCDFFTNRVTYTGTDGDCGNAINACGALSLEAVTGGGAKTDWYLPSQKELMQAYINGAYNKTNTTWAKTSNFWSSTEQSDSAGNAWYVFLYNGLTVNDGKTGTGPSVRCVRRD